MVRRAYPPSNHIPTTVNLAPIDPSCTDPSDGASLGLQWDLKDDIFNIKTEFKFRPKTKRGFLGYVMSPYDPFGMAQPAMLICKLIQRELFPPKDQDPHQLHVLGWDDPIPQQFDKQWHQMIRTCQEVTKLKIPRSFYPKHQGTPRGI